MQLAHSEEGSAKSASIKHKIREGLVRISAGEFRRSGTRVHQSDGHVAIIAGSWEKQLQARVRVRIVG